MISRSMPQKAAKTTTTTSKKFNRFSDEERAAMKEYIREKKGEVEKANGEGAVLEAINKLPEPDRTMGKRLHSLIKDSAPSLAPRTWLRDARVRQQGWKCRLLLPEFTEVQD